MRRLGAGEPAIVSGLFIRAVLSILRESVPRCAGDCQRFNYWGCAEHFQGRRTQGGNGAGVAIERDGARGRIRVPQADAAVPVAHRQDGSRGRGRCAGG